MQNEQFDNDAINLAKAIRQSESGGKMISGKSGEYGTYQFTPDTWNEEAPHYGFNVPLEKSTAEQQNAVAYGRIKKWKDSGKNVSQIASMWNAGAAEPDAWKGTFGSTTKTHQAGDPSVGVNKFGAKYDVPAYTKSIESAYQSLKNGGQVQADPSNPSSVTPVNPNTQPSQIGMTEQTPPPGEEDKSLKADSGTGVWGGINDVAGGLTGVTKLGQGLGYTISNMMGTQDDVIKANDQAMEIQGNLIKKIKENKAQGKDTSRLQKALVDLTEQIQKTGSQISDVGTGGISNADVLKSSAQTALTVLTAPSLIKSSIGLLSTLKGGSALTSSIIKNALADYGVGANGVLNTGDKVAALTEAFKAAGPVEQKVLQQGIEELMPLAIKEAGGVVKFSELYPKLAKTGSVAWNIIKKLTGLAGTAVVGGDILNKITGK